MRAALEVVAHAREDRAAERHLPRVGEIAFEAGVVHRVAARLDAPQQANADLAHAGEERVELAHGQPRLVEVEQRVVAALGVTVAVGHLALELDHPLQRRGIAGEVVVRARLAPGDEARSPRDGHLLHQIRRELRRLLVEALRLAHEAAVGVAKLRLPHVRRQQVDELPDARIRDAPMDKPLDGGELLPADLVRAVWELRLLVPGGEAGERGEVGDLLREGEQLLDARIAGGEGESRGSRSRVGGRIRRRHALASSLIRLIRYVLLCARARWNMPHVGRHAIS